MSIDSSNSKKTERFSMPKLEIIGYETTDDQEARAEDYSEKRGCSYFSACSELGFRPIYAQNVAELTEKDKAQNTMDAIDYILNVSRNIGMIAASESSHPRFSGYNELTSQKIDSLEASGRMNTERAKTALRKAIGGQVLKSLGFDIDPKKATDKDIDVLFDDLYKSITGPDNRPKREKMRRELSKILTDK